MTHLAPTCGTDVSDSRALRMENPAKAMTINDRTASSGVATPRISAALSIPNCRMKMEAATIAGATVKEKDDLDAK